ncbi:RNA helicase [Coprinopsis sp. MPI-PUGE-AT-0042]|nr:RNA helicase [Coprinopsis sp. MPI-PUGE-AT-0042]
MSGSTNCPAVVALGRCSSTNCPYNHAILACEPCSYIALDADDFAFHVQSKKHHSTVTGVNEQFQCPLCVVNMHAGIWEQHINGRKHRQQAIMQGVSPTVDPLQATSTPKFTFCEVCKIPIEPRNWERHIQSQRHRGKETFMQYRAVLDESEKDKNGLVVEGGGDLGYRDPTSTTGTLSFQISIKSTVPFGKSVLREAKLFSQHGAQPVASGFSVTSATFNIALTSLRPGHVKLTFRNNFIGRYEDRLELVFEDTQLKKRFMISRPLQIVVGNQAEHEALRPKIPYTPRPRTAREPIKKTVKGVRPRAADAIRYVTDLPHAYIPARLLAVLNGSESIKKQVAHIRRVHLPAEVSSSTYARHIKTLLWVEEHKADADLGRYDMPAVLLEKFNQYYYLGIPGLAEKRPSVLVGDRILVQKVDAPTGHWFEGHVHIVRRDQVGLCFHTSFAGWTRLQRYNIRFKLNRIVLRRQHQALDSAFEEDRVLFPLQQHVLPMPYRRIRLVYFNSLISGNEPQVRAVSNIVHLPPGSPPFVVFGPPGTGKTITIVEAIRQVIQKNPQARILACAPSNSAADLIAERLCVGLGPDVLFRMYAPSRSKDQMPDGLRNHVYINTDGNYSVPIMMKMKSFRVIVATCVAASMVSGIGMPRGHFSHIFIDEAGQATEPEAFISIKTMSDSLTNIILSGDPKQLGPIIRSPIARILGLENSYLQRLMESEAYVVDPHNTIVVKLIKNFRSHPAILRFPNERFYAGDLQPCAPAATINAFLNSPFLPRNPKFPVVFHAVSGKDDREASSPSFFNVDEVLQVKAYVQRLKEGRTFRATDNEIGVITPYHAQCLRIRTALRSVADSVKVGSVEEFQGQERKVIIISTVRSSKDFVEYDLRHTLGFVANPRRFNVAVTRAQALLIIVGNPHVLGLDPLWRSFLNYIYVNNSWTGSMDIPWDPDSDDDDDDDQPYDARARKQAELDMNDFTRRMEELALGNAEDGANEEDANVDRPWRDVE